MAIFNDPGVYVLRRMQPTALTPVIPAQPVAYIGPMFQIVELDDALSDVTISGEELGKNKDDASDVVVSYPSLASSKAKVDIGSVRVFLRRSDGREAEITDVCEIDADGVTLKYTDPVGAAFDARLKEINDDWGGKSDSGDFSGVDGVPVFIEYRAHRADLVGQVLEAQGADGVAAVIGKAVPENPLGLAGRIGAIVNETGMYFVPTPEVLDATSVGDALALLEPINVYAPVLLSDNPLLQQIVINHVTNMSSDEERKFRIAWTYYPVPTREDLENDPQSGIDENSPLSQVKAAQRDAIMAYAQSIFNSKAIVIYDDFTTEIDGEDVELPGYYLCAAYAALKSQIAPQQGLTNYPLPGVVKRLKYGSHYFKPSDLKSLSQAGVFVVLQTVDNGPIFSRHQVTTNTMNNKTKQVSLQYSVDRYSATLIETLNKIIGIVNVTDETMEIIRQTISGVNRGFRESGMITQASIAGIAPDGDNGVRVKMRVAFSTPLDVIIIELEF